MKENQLTCHSFKVDKNIDGAPDVDSKEQIEHQSCATFFNSGDLSATKNLCKSFSNLAKLCPKTCDAKDN